MTKEISLLDGLLVLAHHKRLIALVTALGVALGVLVALVTPHEYTASAVLVREASEAPGGGGSLAALRGLGLGLGGAESGLTAEAYPEILTSREVRAPLLGESFTLAGGTRITLQQYVAATSGGLGAWLRGLRRGDGEEGRAAVTSDDSLAVRYTADELEAMNRLREMIGVDADLETGLMTVTVTARDPLLAATLTGRLIEELRDRVQAIRTQKSRENLAFIGARAAEAEADLRRARNTLARFDDRNRGAASARLLAEREWLRQEVTFAAQVYGEYQSELKQAELEVQRASPVLTVLDRPVVPLQPSKPHRKTVVLIWALLGLGLGLVLAFVAEGVRVETTGETGRRKREALREALRLRRPRRAPDAAARAAPTQTEP